MMTILHRETIEIYQNIYIKIKLVKSFEIMLNTWKLPYAWKGRSSVHDVVKDEGSSYFNLGQKQKKSDDFFDIF